jgi:Kinesin motor domain
MGSHELNVESSRSHSIMTVYCDWAAAGEEGQSKYLGKISFVDLAGSERLKDSKSCGEALKETSSINRSLFTLGKVTTRIKPLISSVRFSVICIENPNALIVHIILPLRCVLPRFLHDSDWRLCVWSHLTVRTALLDFLRMFSPFVTSLMPAYIIFTKARLSYKLFPFSKFTSNGGFYRALRPIPALRHASGCCPSFLPHIPSPSHSPPPPLWFGFLYYHAAPLRKGSSAFSGCVQG